ncbi:TPA: hypothetical protein DCX16_01250 [bacterium]|nr:hypothetical protein [bacterium]
MNSICEWLFCLFIIILPFYYDLSLASKTDLSKLLLVNIFVVISLFLWIFTKSKKISIGKIGIILFVFLIITGISTIFSYHRQISLVGTYMRYQGLMTEVFYFVLYLIVLNLIRQERYTLLINSAIIGGIGSSVYGILQAYGKDPIGWEVFSDRVSASFGNPVFLAAYLAMLCPLSFAMFLKDMKKTKWIYAGAFILIFTGLLFTRTRAGIVAFMGGMTMLFLFAGALKTLKDKNVHYLLLCTLGIFILSNFYSKTAIMQRFTAEILHKPKETASLEERFVAPPVGGSGGLRLLMWKGGMDIVKDHPLFGIGPEVLQFLWPRYAPLGYMSKTGQVTGVDRVHNEVVDVAITRGIIGFIAYIFLICFLFLSVIRFKRKEKIVFIGLFCAALAYLIQNQFSFAELVITGYFYIFLGIMDGIKKEQFLLPMKKWFFVPIFLIIAFFSYRVVFLYSADRAYYQGDYKKAIKLNPYERTYYGALAGFYIDRGNYEEAIEVLKDANKNIPDECNFYNIIGVAYQREEAKYGVNRTEDVISAYKKAIELNPYFVDARINLANYYITKGMFQDAANEFKEALKIQPWQEGWIDSLKSIHLTMKSKTAIQDFEEISRLNPDSYEIHKTLSQLYYESGDIDNFIRKCKDAIKANPKDILMRRNLAAIYYQMKDYENAKKELDLLLLISPNDPEANKLLFLLKEEGRY